MLDVSRALESATLRHPGFDWATSTQPLHARSFEISTQPPRLLLDPALDGASAFAAIIEGIEQLDAIADVADVVPLFRPHRCDGATPGSHATGGQ